MTLSVEHLQWLRLIHYQELAAREQSMLPMPLAMLAVNGLHDAVEAVLGLAVEHRSVTVRGKEFAQLLDAILAAAPTLAPHRTSIVALNSARVGFKHHGNVLDRMTIDRHRVNAENFLVDITADALGENFEQISMTGFITDQEAREHVEAAEMAWSQQDGPMAMARLRLAFERLIIDYENRKSWTPHKSLFTTQPQHAPSGHDLFADRRMNYAEEWLKALDDRVKLMTFGVDVRRYAYFDAHAPQASVLSGDLRVTERPGVPATTEEIFHRCHRFVIDTSLHLGAEDYEFDAWAGRMLIQGADGSYRVVREPPHITRLSD